MKTSSSLSDHSLFSLVCDILPGMMDDDLLWIGVDGSGPIANGDLFPWQEFIMKYGSVRNWPLPKPVPREPIVVMESVIFYHGETKVSPQEPPN